MRASTPKAVSEPKTPGTGPAFRLPFDNSFFRDMQGFYVPWKPEPSPAPAWVQFNDALALELGLEPATLKSATGLAWLSGVEMPAEAAPLAQAYAGHQFGQFSPHLGDGRALLLGELMTRQDSVGTWPSRGRAVRRFRAVAMARRHWARRCASTSWARPCTRWAFPRRVRWR